MASLQYVKDGADGRTTRRVDSISHLQGHDAGSGAVLVDLVHGSLQSHSLLGEILQVFGALLGFLMRLAHLRKETKIFNKLRHIRANDEEE